QGPRARPDPHGVGVGGPHLQRRRRPAGGGRDRHAGGVGALPGPLRRAGRGLPRLGAAAGLPRPPGGGGGRAAELVALGGGRGRRPGHDHVRRVRPPEGPVRALRVHPGERRRAGEEVDMSVPGTQVNPRLAALTEAGVSVWLDQIRRSLIESGELQRLIDEDCLRGITANPSIFEKAILGSDDYDAALSEMAHEGLSAQEIYERIAVEDVQMAADVMRPVWEDNDRDDGFISLEVAPELANDTD